MMYYSRIKDAAKDFKMSYTETSAKDNINVEGTFMKLVQQVLRSSLELSYSDTRSDGPTIQVAAFVDSDVEGKRDCCSRK